MSDDQSEYSKKMEARLYEVDADIKDLYAKVRKARGEMKLEHERRIESLVAKRQSILDKLHEMDQIEDGQKKDRLKEKLENAWDEFNSAATEVVSRIQNSLKQEA